MRVVLACVFACVCVAAALPRGPHWDVRSPKEKYDGGWLVKTDKDRHAGTVFRGETQKKWEVTKDGKADEVYGSLQRDLGVRGSWGK